MPTMGTMAEHDPSDRAAHDHGTGADHPVEFAEHAEHAGFAEVAEVAEVAGRAEYAEYAEHVEHQPLAGDDTALEEQEVHHQMHHLLEDKEAAGHHDGAWRTEMLHLLHAANRLQTAGLSKLHRQDRPEPRWPVSAAVIFVIVLQSLLPIFLHSPIDLVPGHCTLTLRNASAECSPRP